ncbi:MAG: DNA mismatch repair endonuclease MutL [Bacteroidota bacterium]|nr:DNA mismatch repair endonuclease MutL [Bacteroidota bacterium]
MPDIIKLLPDSVANQIAAGEVVQRPASAVKELMENAVDAGAGSIKVIIKDAGRTLIQVVDDGSGMSDTDARISFERHATSKIKSADDLFNLHTMGFRGEALASIAAIAQVELKTKRDEDETGTSITIEGSVFKLQEAVAMPTGTSFSIKNLFFNVPARRNFLKSDAVEFRHIVEEFERVAFAHSHIAFSLHHNGVEIFNLAKGNLRQRIIALYGNPYNQRLVPVDESTDIVRVTGFICKPEFAKRTRGEQYFFLNNRFIKNGYLHHAVQAAFEQLLAHDSFPGYFLFLEVDPHTIDVNIHPTKTEVKFEDERAVYAILRSAVKRALGQYNISPTIDFEQEMSMEIPYNQKGVPVAPGIHVNPNYNPFTTNNPDTAPGNYSGSSFSQKEKSGNSNWQEMFNSHIHKDAVPSDTFTPATGESQQLRHSDMESADENKTASNIWQLHERYILTPVKSGILVIDQQRAHERILFEKYLRAIEQHNAHVQQLLFPETLEFSPSDSAIVSSLLEDFNALGFDLRSFGNNTYVVHGIPAGTEEKGCIELLEGVLETYKMNEQELHLAPKENMARSMAKQAAVKAGRSLSIIEMRALADELFACEMPSHAPDGKPAFINFPIDELDRRFKR